MKRIVNSQHHRGRADSLVGEQGSTVRGDTSEIEICRYIFVIELYIILLLFTWTIQCKQRSRFYLTMSFWRFLSKND